MESTNWKYAVAASLGAAAGAAVCFLALRQARSHAVPAPRCPRTASAGCDARVHVPTCASVRRFREDEILTEQLTRNIQFFTADNQQRVADAFVIVVGLGGVGSHAAHMLLRSGVGRLRLVDFDLVTLSSLNRHAVATREDVGSPKATCLAKHFARIMPEAEVEACVQMYTAEAEASLLAGQPSFVLDAIDNIDTKVALVAACKRRGLPVLSVAGAGAKADPTRLHVVDIGESSNDPLAKALRLRLKRDHGISWGVPVLLSTEKPRCKLVASEEMMASGNLADFQVVPNFRVRTIPVLGTTPAAFGMAAAGWMLCQLAGMPFETAPIMILEGRQYDDQLALLAEREMNRWGSACPPLPVDRDDVVYLLRELWRGFSAKAGPPPRIPGGDKGLKRATGHLCLTRWDASKPAHVDNLVLLTFEEADAHDATSLVELRLRDPEYCERVERVLTKARNEHYY